MSGSPPTKRLRNLRLFGIGLVLLVLPNGYWLVRSTAEIRNASDIPIERIEVHVDGEILTETDLGGGRTRFLTLPRSGDATLSVRAFNRSAVGEGCSEYVEGSMIHIAIQVDRRLEITCTSSLPLFSDLLILRWIFR